MMTIEFWLDGSAGEVVNAVTYLPYGTRSVRVRVRTKRTLPPLRLRPQAFLAVDRQNGIFKGYEDGVDEPRLANFELSWGGGHEDGPCTNTFDFLGAFEKCAEMEPEDSQVIIFNLTHVTTKLPETAEITLGAYEEERLVATVKIALRAPAGLPESVQRFIQMEPGNWLLPSGTHLPSYMARWWPEDEVVYEPMGQVPPVRLQMDTAANKLHLYWNQTVIATIEDHTNPTILDRHGVRVEMFNFDEHYYAVRVWFFWLDVNIGHGFFIGRHEVPDAERFDFLIRKKDGYVGLACTDLHWRESWGIADEVPVLATIGLTREVKLKLAKKELVSLWDKIWGNETKETEPYNPLGFIQRRAKREIRHDDFTVRGSGTESHVPSLVNVTTEENGMTSSDVRLG